MAEDLIIPATATREELYKAILPQLRGLMTGEKDLVANLANVAAGLKQSLNFFWVGFYLVKDRQLVLGPFQGPVACTRIDYGKGVCGTCWKEKRTIIVPDVDAFPGHIACSSASKSEIVLPCVVHEEVTLVLDVDSDKLNDFDEVDSKYLQQVVEMIAESM